MLRQELISERLARSAFRRRFRLSNTELEYLRDKGLPLVLDHARDLIARRLAAAVPRNDGKQTPMRGHPAFVAQHATATCCRSCLSKWHGIGMGTMLTQEQQVHVVESIRRWLVAHVADHLLAEHGASGADG